MAQQFDYPNSRRLRIWRIGKTLIYLSRFIAIVLTCVVAVLTRLLFPHRRLRFQRQFSQRLKRTCEIRRLDPRYLFCIGHAGHQLHRKVAFECR